MPACLVPGNDNVHTPVAARGAAALLPDNELHEDVVEKRGMTICSTTGTRKSAASVHTK
ncbi:MAG: hypothetical protein H7125_01800 [Proteobacteria bacterium]|nr:hypothetical protein [Burkholderiales bacterium]